MRLSDVISGMEVIRQDADPSLDISGIAYDSRRVKPGFMFAAVPGFKVDGHNFVPRAKEAGAAAILTERWLEDAGVPQIQTDIVRRSMALAAANFFGHPSRRLGLVGVTGTNGKTTTTHLVDSIMRAGGKKTGLIGGIEYVIGEKTTPANRTTPEAVDLQDMLAQMAGEGVEVAALEVSSHGIELYRVAWIDFDVAVFTNLTHEHLDLHGDMESYFQVKRRLFAGDLEGRGASAPAGRRPQPVINVDDDWGKRLAGELGQALTFGIFADVDISAANVRRDGWETSFDLETPGGRAAVRLHLVGEYNLHNALAAAGAAFALGAPPELIAKGLSSARSIPGRFELVTTEAPFAVIVDYAHNEDGLAKSLCAARVVTKKRLIVVFGCPGERDRDKRPEMGRIAGSLSDLAILTTDDCYGEPPEKILDDVEPGLKASLGRYLRVPDRRQAIEAALNSAGPGDTVLIAGKGHETSQIMAEGPVPFSDRQTVEEILART